MLGIKKLFGRKEEVNPKKSFWDWFVRNEHRFKSVMSDSEKAQLFLDELIERMKPFNPWFKALAGPYDDKTFELIITADGDIALFCKIEELVQAAPVINDWKITAHKPAIGLDKMQIKMYGHEFSTDNMKFYPVEDANYPDEIKIVLVHPDYKKEEKNNFQTAGMIFLKNALGELNTATLIDSYEVKKIPVEKIELMPLNKLSEYLKWREKEFVEKYEGFDAERPEDSFSILESTDSEGLPVFAFVNSGYKTWEFKAAFPWCIQIDIDYKGTEKGLPEEEQMKELQEIEDQLLNQLSGRDFINIGHDTNNNRRSIYSYASDYKSVSKKIHQFLENANWKYQIVYFLKKDKYWRNMEWFFDASEQDAE